MAESNYNDHNLSRGGASQPPGPTRQHHRLANGDKVSGTSAPNGPAVSGQNKIAGQSKTY